MMASPHTAILGLGSDLLRIERMARLGRRNGRLVIERMLARAERDELAGHGERDADWPECAPRIAAIVAAKEAFFKALGTGLVRPLRWIDVAVSRGGGAVGRTWPGSHGTLDLRGAAAAAFAKLGGGACHLTLCADDTFVLSTVIILGHPASSTEGSQA